MRLHMLPGPNGDGAVVYVGDLVLTVIQVDHENGDVSYDVLVEGHHDSDPETIPVNISTGGEEKVVLHV